MISIKTSDFLQTMNKSLQDLFEEECKSTSKGKLGKFTSKRAKVFLAQNLEEIKENPTK